MNAARNSITRLVRSVGALIGMTVVVCVVGCANSSPRTMTANDCNSPADHEIKVMFDADGCPADVEVAMASRCVPTDKHCVRVPNGKPRIRWYSEPAATRFGIFFDPLMGPQYIAANGCLTRNLNSSVPPVPGKSPIEYKYTVAAMGSGNNLKPDCEALDPKVIVEH